MATITGNQRRRVGGNEVMDGSGIKELVGNEAVFNNFVNHKFEALDTDCDGNLSVRELQPAVADIGAALGLPSQGSSSESDYIYSEVLKEFTHGKGGQVSKVEFKEVLSDILLGMAAGLKRDPIVILRLDGEDLLEFICSPNFEPEIVSIYSEMKSPDGSLHDHIIKALEKLTVDRGMPPPDSWVRSNIIEPVLQLCANHGHELPTSQETFLVEFKKVAEGVARLLKEQPVIVAHSENTFDGSAIKTLVYDKLELDKSLDAAMTAMTKDESGNVPKEFLRVALDTLGSSAGLPPYGAINEMDKVVEDALKWSNADDGEAVDRDEFKKMLTEILGRIMLKLERNPIQVSSNSILHEPLASPSAILSPTSK